MASPNKRSLSSIGRLLRVRQQPTAVLWFQIQESDTITFLTSEEPLYKGNTPTTILMQATKRVPGAPQSCRNLFDLSQILAWLAKERRDLQEQLEWREEIPDLMAPLLKGKRA